MNSIPYIDIHTHASRSGKDTITVTNIYPGDGFAAFTGQNFYSVGLHPWHIGTADDNNETLRMLESALEFDHVIFVGEAGLDKLKDNNFAEQQRVFEAQAFIAEEYNYPLVIHCVKAYNEVIELRKKMKPAMPWIMHSYSGSIEMTQQMVDLGFLFSFGMNLFSNSAKTVESFLFLPLNKIFFETDEADSPVEAIYKKGAELKQVPLEELKYMIWKNFNRIEKSLTGRVR